MPEVINQDNKEQKASERNAVKGSYKSWSKTLSYKDLVKHAETCYNTYMEAASNKMLPKDQRVAFMDQAIAYQEMKEYIERQIS